MIHSMWLDITYFSYLIIILLDGINMNSFSKFGNVQFDIIASFSMLDTICNLPVIATI